MLELIAPFMVGLLGSLHCLGMCGPLVLAYSLHYRTAARGRGVLGLSGAFVHHVAFHLGRITTYGVLGAAVAGLFHALEVQRFSALYRGGFQVFSGVLLFVLGLFILRVLPAPAFVLRLFSGDSALGRKMGTLAGSRNPASKAGLGLAAGLLPCGLSWAMLVTAASTLNPADGFMTMVAFGLGTIPLLLAVGVSASFFCVKTRLLGEKAAALAVMAMGGVLLVKGGLVLCGIGGGCHGI